MPSPIIAQLTIADLFAHYASVTGTELNAYIGEREASILATVNQRIALLQGEDQKVNDFLNQVKTLLDADQASEGFQEGLNVFQTIASSVEALSNRIGATNGDVGNINNSIDAFVADLTALAARVLALEIGLTNSLARIGENEVSLSSINAALVEAAARMTEVTVNFSRALRGTGGPRGVPTSFRP